MSDFQEQAKNWLRNVVKQNPDKIKAGVEKAGDMIDKQTGGKYAEKVDAVQQKVGDYVDKSSDGTASQPQAESPSAEQEQSGPAEASNPDAPDSTVSGQTESSTGESRSDGGLPGPR